MSFSSIDSLRDFEVLGDTPIGYLAVIPWGGGAAVAIMHEEDRSKPKRIIHQLEPGENPLNAIYGKRAREQRQVEALYDKARETRAATTERANADHRKDTRKAIDKFLAKHNDDGREAVVTYLSLPRFVRGRPA